MNPQTLHFVAVSWLVLIIVLTLFWYFVLSRLSAVVNERLKATRSNEDPPEGLPGFFLFILRGDFRSTRDDQLTAICNRLRRLLYGYMGMIGGFIVFIVIIRSRG